MLCCKHRCSCDDAWSKRCCSCELIKDATCSFVADETDGRLARKYKQTSTLGAVLDMVTDRYVVWSGCFVAKHRTGADGAASACADKHEFIYKSHHVAIMLLHVVT